MAFRKIELDYEQSKAGAESSRIQPYLQISRGSEIKYVVGRANASLWRYTPSQYLEEIFQVVLTLPPLDAHGYQRLVRTLVGTRVDRPAPAPKPVDVSGARDPFQHRWLNQL